MSVTRHHPHHDDISREMWTDIDRIIEETRNAPGAVIPVLRRCQDVVGYLPMALIDHISFGLNLARSEVLGVATFYSLFSLTPKGRHTIKVCTGTACYVKGIKEIISRIENEYHVAEGETSEDRRFSLQGVRCLGACGLAPVMVISGDTHGNLKPEAVVRILNDYS